jgi:serine protease AprX
MNKKLFFSIALMLIISMASASFSSDNGHTGKEKLLSGDSGKVMNKKIDPLLAAKMKIGSDEKIPVLIELKKKQKTPFDIKKTKSLAIDSQSALAASLKEMHVRNIEQHWLVNVISAEVEADNINTITEHPDVEKVWLNRQIKYIKSLSNPSIADYGDEKIDAQQVWDLGYDGTGITIAILDSGIDDTHPDLDGGKVIAAKDFTNENTTDDLFGHGTHVSGIAAGEHNTSTNVSGVAPGASLINAKVLAQDGSSSEDWAISGLEWSMEQNADIISMSFGDWQGDGTGRDPLSMAVTNTVNAGHVVVVAAGNEGPGEATIGYPAIVTDAIAVAASDDNDKITNFSSRGPTGDGRVGIDLAAPGVDIVSANAMWETDDYYTTMNGSSMACPHVAGAAALLLDAYPDLSPEDVKQALMNGADDIGNDILEQGAGRLDVAKAYYALTNGIQVDDPLWFVGRVYQGNYVNTFTVYNNNDVDVTVTITSSSGDVGDWISLNDTNVSVPAHGSASFDATMNVATTIPGTYYGNINVSDGSSDIVIPVSVNVIQRVKSDTIDYIEGDVDEDFWYDTESFFYGGDFVYYTLDVQPGITTLNLSLNWNNSNNDLDFLLLDPDGNTTVESATFGVPEIITVDNPAAGNWMVMIQAWRLITFPETYNLTIDAKASSEDSISVHLHTGWNLISVPLELPTWELGEEDVVGNPLNVTPKNSLSSIYRYNATTGLFEKCDHFDDVGWWAATGSESFTKLEPGRGYWVMAKQDCDLTFTGTNPDDLNVGLDAGWNLVGWYSTYSALLGEEAVVKDPLNVTPKNSLSSIYQYNATTGLFEKCDHFDDVGWWAATGSESFTKLEPGRGYWVMAKNNCEWMHEV